MKNLFLFLSAAFILTGCDSNKEIQEALSGLKEKKAKTESLITSGSFDTDSLLQIQEYFFDLSEEMYLMKIDPQAAKEIDGGINRMTVKKFCHDFLIQKVLWQRLDQNCRNNGEHTCSTEMERYPELLTTFKGLLSTTTLAKINNERECLERF